MGTSTKCTASKGALRRKVRSQKVGIRKVRRRKAHVCAVVSRVRLRLPNQLFNIIGTCTRKKSRGRKNATTKLVAFSRCAPSYPPSPPHHMKSQESNSPRNETHERSKLCLARNQLGRRRRRRAGTVLSAHARELSAQARNQLSRCGMRRAGTVHAAYARNYQRKRGTSWAGAE